MVQLSKINVWNKDNNKMEQMYNEIEELTNILGYVDFAKLCNVINNFPDFNQIFLKEGITLPLFIVLELIYRAKTLI